MITEKSVAAALAKYAGTALNEREHSASYDQEYYLRFHEKRYMESLLFIEGLLQRSPTVLELGEPGPFTYLINHFFPDVTIHYVQEDLRYSITKDSNSYDLILNMEVIEHIKDQKESILTEVDFSGLKQFIRECHRVLKPGGKMFVTTPNAGSYNNLNLLFNHEPGWMWRNHFREFQPKELSGFLTEGGFSVTTLATLHVWPQRNDHRYTRIIKLLDSLKKSMRFSSSNKFLRGDEIFLICEKR